MFLDTPMCHCNLFRRIVPLFTVVATRGLCTFKNEGYYVNVQELFIFSCDMQLGVSGIARQGNVESVRLLGWLRSLFI